jgi:hypothetical protein
MTGNSLELVTDHSSSMQEALDRISSPIKRKKQNKKKVKSEKFFEQLKFGLRETSFFEKSLAVYLRPAWNSKPSCFHLLSAEITDVCQ